jgi:hypothetical protein
MSSIDGVQLAVLPSFLKAPQMKQMQGELRRYPVIYAVFWSSEKQYCTVLAWCDLAGNYAVNWQGTEIWGI